MIVDVYGICGKYTQLIKTDFKLYPIISNSWLNSAWYVLFNQVKLATFSQVQKE